MCKPRFGTAAAFEFGLSDIAERVESDRTGDRLRILDVPVAVTGVLEPSRGDHYLIHVTKGERLEIGVAAKRLGSALDVSLTLLGPDGKTLGKNDDLAGTTDAGLSFQAPADGEYRIMVRDLSGRAGKATSVYRLSVTQPSAGFHIFVPERVETIIGAEPVAVSGKKKRRRGDQAGVLTVQVNRHGGFKGSILLELSGATLRDKYFRQHRDLGEEHGS